MADLRVFFDADALLAGSASTTGASHLLLHLSDLGLIHGVTSVQAREEARRNLARKIPTALPEFESLVGQAVEVVADPSQVDIEPFHDKAHPKDLPILVAAIQTRASWLVTFNTKDFYDPPGIRVLDPGQALQSIRTALLRADEANG